MERTVAAPGKNEIDMLHGPLLFKILRFALPLAASSTLQMLFNLADVAVVGRFAGAQALAAVGSNSPVVTLLLNVFVGLSVGANVIISSAIGRGDEKKLPDMVQTVMTMALISGVLLVFAGQLTSRWLLTLMGSPDDVLPLAVLYLRIYFMGAPFFMLYNFGAAVLRSKGDTRRPLYSLSIAGVINVLLNLLLVIVFKLGVAGVAIATVISNVISATMVVVFLVREQGPLHYSPLHLQLNGPCVRGVIAIGAPTGLQGVVFSLSNIVIQSSINSFGSYAMAGCAAALNFENLNAIAFNAFSQATVTFTSQNYAAGQRARCRRVLWMTGALSVGCALVVESIFLFGRNWWVRMYSTDPAVIQYAVTRMVYVLPMQGIMSIYEAMASSLRGMGRSLLPAMLTVAGSCGVRLLWIYTVFARVGTFTCLLLVYPVSWTVTLVGMFITYQVITRRDAANHPAAP